ncbi:hypothetical protein [Paraburkholderia sp. BCC1884]|uniref:hypothetical protein n=1 Tax=Paraburkholderia sp. BCC1884 TaxID=2562668 RepID=UPI0011844EC6|nr:hypothetical protein [Paraburkholderia sp. BCC1884]
METATFWRCARDAWVDAWKIISRRPTWVAIAATALLVANTLPITLNHLDGSAVHASRLLPSVTLLARSVVMVALSVTVMQQIMLGEPELRLSSMFGKEFRRYFRVSAMLMLALVAVGVVLIGGGTVAFRALGLRHAVWFEALLLGAIIVFLCIFVFTRFSLLFCHVAIGGDMKWRAAWKDTRGHFWRIALSHLLTGLPVGICAIGLLLLARVAFRSLDTVTVAYVVAIVQSLFTVVGLVAGSACSCWLYRRFALKLRESV